MPVQTLTRETTDIPRSVRGSGLEDIYDKVMAGDRLSFEDGMRLYVADLNAVGTLANLVRERKNGDNAYFVRNQHINYSNICNKFCKFCSFYALPRDANAYTLSPEQIQDRIRQHLHLHVQEVHMVAGINPRLPYSYYTDMLRAVKEVRPDIHVRAFTMVEIAHIVRIAKKPFDEVIAELRAAGLDSLPGGGAEIFSQRVHDELFRQKQNGDEWLDLVTRCHRNGLRSNATMLYGHIETTEEKVDHLVRLRAAQDETGGFMTYIPLCFHPERTELTHIPLATGQQNLREIAVGRLMLDNFDHVKAFWMMISIPIAQLALWYGADDIDGTIVDYEIVHADGGATPYRMTREGLIALIREASRTPIERDSDYRPRHGALIN
ncbi:MAG: aminofutalosine synthase MqnE [Armatimonadetes bacterium]|nr:aminofutalosine synthase MqnE [Armatimonadota bacterium]